MCGGMTDLIALAGVTHRPVFDGQEHARRNRFTPKQAPRRISWKLALEPLSVYQLIEAGTPSPHPAQQR